MREAVTQAARLSLSCPLSRKRWHLRLETNSAALPVILCFSRRSQGCFWRSRRNFLISSNNMAACSIVCSRMGFIKLKNVEEEDEFSELRSKPSLLHKLLNEGNCVSAWKETSVHVCIAERLWLIQVCPQFASPAQPSSHIFVTPPSFRKAAIKKTKQKTTDNLQCRF